MATINGTGGDDIITPDQTDPALQTTDDADTVDGGGGDDTIIGGGGDDTLDGGDGSDLVSGGDGADTFLMSGGSSEDEDGLFGGEGADIFTVDEEDGVNGDIYIDGGVGDDQIDAGFVGSTGTITVNISSGGGTDTIIGFEFGKDQLYIGDIDPETIVIEDIGSPGGPPFINEFKITVPGVGVFTVNDPNIFADVTIDQVKASFVTSDDYTPPVDPLCLTAGTRVATPGGEVAVEDLQIGDLVETRDHGPQPVRWIGRRTCDGRGRFAPVVIRKGALGNWRDLAVSPHHRMAVGGARAQALFGAAEVLVAACDLVDGDRIHHDRRARVDYVHLSFDRHEIIFAEGCATESLNPLAEDLDAFGAAAREELLEIFPDLRVRDGDRWLPARPALSTAEARLLS